MSASNKVFIYKDQYVSCSSAIDIATFFRESKGIFDSKPDIIEFDPSFRNADGLKIPTFVVPGGAATLMTQKLLPIFKLVQENSTVKNEFNYVGVCAGAFAATQVMNTFVGSPYFVHYLDRDGLNLVNDFKAVGAFCPVDTVNPSQKQFVPYVVTERMNHSGHMMKQLYVNGPGFFSVKDMPVLSEVIATYEDRQAYDFAFPKEKIKYEKLPAMVRRKANETHGGIFLTGTHFEVCVDESQLLAHCLYGVDKFAALSDKDALLLQDKSDRDSTNRVMQDVLRATLK